MSAEPPKSKSAAAVVAPPTASPTKPAPPACPGQLAPKGVWQLASTPDPPPVEPPPARCGQPVEPAAALQYEAEQPSLPTGQTGFRRLGMDVWQLFSLPLRLWPPSTL
mmetsp:Transcript_31867/g.102929  ORF Transcript_31867/g.102929 Transcript_31867/m.102929 type:complete len:108 (+) Transcript_31867:959-1282(+)